MNLALFICLPRCCFVVQDLARGDPIWTFGRVKQSGRNPCKHYVSPNWRLRPTDWHSRRWPDGMPHISIGACTVDRKVNIT